MQKQTLNNKPSELINYEEFKQAICSSGLDTQNASISSLHHSAVNIDDWKKVEEALKNKAAE